MHATAQPKKETPMSIKYSTLNFALLLLAASAILLGTLPAPRSALATADSDGVVKVESVYGFGETITRLEADIAKKGIKFFLAVDQSQFGADAGIKLKPSTLLIFGNPPLGIQFLTSNPDSGLDWPVRLLVRQDDDGHVWAVYTDFSWVAKRHGITDRKDQFKMASDVIASITSSVTSKP
jgi:uncharacterized protein (DUF302 family)